MRVRYLVVLVGGLLILAISQVSRTSARMIVCDVGQGDGILVVKGSAQVVVDGGPSGEKIMDCLGKYMPFWDRNIEIVVMTNTDRDHSGGLAAVVSSYEIDKFVTADGLKNTLTFRDLVDVVRERSVEAEVVEYGDKIKIGEELMIEVLWPVDVDESVAGLFSETNPQVLGEWDGGDVNERSVVMELTINEKKVLLMGDAGMETEERLIEMGVIDDIDVLKVGHHGSKYATSEEFLKMIRPEYAVISVGKNSYGHPTSEAMSRLNGVGLVLYRTDEMGNVVFDF